MAEDHARMMRPRMPIMDGNGKRRLARNISPLPHALTETSPLTFFSLFEMMDLLLSSRRLAVLNSSRGFFPVFIWIPAGNGVLQQRPLLCPFSSRRKGVSFMRSIAAPAMRRDKQKQRPMPLSVLLPLIGENSHPETAPFHGRGSQAGFLYGPMYAFSAYLLPAGVALCIAFFPPKNRVFLLDFYPCLAYKPVCTMCMGM